MWHTISETSHLEWKGVSGHMLSRHLLVICRNWKGMRKVHGIWWVTAALGGKLIYKSLLLGDIS